MLFVKVYKDLHRLNGSNVPKVCVNRKEHLPEKKREKECKSQDLNNYTSAFAFDQPHPL